MIPFALDIYDILSPHATVCPLGTFKTYFLRYELCQKPYLLDNACSQPFFLIPIQVDQSFQDLNMGLIFQYKCLQPNHPEKTK